MRLYRKVAWFLVGISLSILALHPTTAVARTINVHTAVSSIEPVQLPPIVVAPVPTQKAQPAPVVKGGCEQYRDIVEKYFGAETDMALFVASKESGCIGDRVSGLNRNGTRDYCLFQINSEAATAKDIELCVQRAHDKFVGGRVGSNNWSAWYAVCTPKAMPKYPGIKCQ